MADDEIRDSWGDVVHICCHKTHLWIAAKGESELRTIVFDTSELPKIQAALEKIAAEVKGITNA